MRTSVSFLQALLSRSTTDYVEELYKDEIVHKEVWPSGNIDLRYSDKVNDTIASVTCTEAEDPGCWVVEIYITFNTPDMMPSA